MILLMWSHLQSMVWHIPHQCLRQIILLHNGTLQDCHPTLSKRCGQCRPIHGLCKMQKSEHANMAPLHQHTKGLEKEAPSINNVECEIWFCPNDIKRCMSDNQNKYVLNWPIIPNTSHVKIDTNLSREEVLALEHIGFQLQQRETLSPHCRLAAIATLPIP